MKPLPNFAKNLTAGVIDTMQLELSAPVTRSTKNMLPKNMLHG
jgi:hypothetical protein